MRRLGILVFCVLVISGAALAQSGGEPSSGAPEPVAAEAAEGPEQPPTVFVSAFRIEGNTVVPGRVLEELLRPMTGRDLTLLDLHLAAAAVATYYHTLGYFLAEAVLPPQEVVDGVITILVFEGRYGDVVIRNESALRDQVVRTVMGPFPSGELVQQGPLERLQRLLAEIPGVEINVGFAPGPQEGTADLVVLVRDGDPVQGQFSLQARPTGGGVSLAPAVALTFNNAAGWGDQLEASFAAGAGGGSPVEQGRLELSLPAGPGAKVGFGYSGARQRMQDPLGLLDIVTWSNTLAVSAAYAPVTEFQRNMSVFARWERADAGRSINGYVTPEQRWRLVVGVDGQRLAFPDDQPGWAAVGAWSVSAAASGAPGTEAARTKLNASVTHRHLWNSGLEVSATVRGQWALANLSSDEKMELRPAGNLGSAAGDAGWLARLEVKQSWSQPRGLPGTWQASLYAETGAVQLERFPAGGVPHIVQRSGIGIGLVWSMPGGHGLQLERAWPLGPVPPAERAGETTVRYVLSF